jgi:potassium efflux system protein
VGLHVAGLQLTALAVFAGMMGIAVGFGSQHIASNFIAGVILTFDRSTDVGDYIEVGGQQGTITQISLRSTTIRTPDNKTVVIPNSSLLNQNVVGTTQRDRRVRMLLDVIVAGDSDPDKVGSVLKQTALDTECILQDPTPEVWITKLAAANLTFQLAAWTDQPQHQDRIRGALTTAVGKALKDNEIAIA